jgi:hypothetical protein
VADAGFTADAGMSESGTNDAKTRTDASARFVSDARVTTEVDGGGTPGGGPSDAAAVTGDAESGSHGDGRVTEAVDRIAVRVHVGRSSLSAAEIAAALAQVNDIWLSQASICFDFEVTMDEADGAGGLDVRLLEDGIMDQPFVHGLTLGPHQIYVVDHPSLYPAPHPVRSFTGRTMAHEFGHAFGLQHENPPDDPHFNDCMEPCVCTASNKSCNDFLMRSHHQGYWLSETEIALVRPHAAQLASSAHASTACSAPIFDNDAGRTRP